MGESKREKERERWNPEKEETERKGRNERQGESGEKTSFKSRPAYTIMRMVGRFCVKCILSMWVYDDGLSLPVPKGLRSMLDIHFKPDHSITLSAIFGVCISIWPLAKEKKIHRSTRRDYLRTPSGCATARYKLPGKGGMDTSRIYAE